MSASQISYVNYMTSSRDEAILCSNEENLDSFDIMMNRVPVGEHTARNVSPYILHVM